MEIALLILLIILVWNSNSRLNSRIDELTEQIKLIMRKQGESASKGRTETSKPSSEPIVPPVKPAPTFSAEPKPIITEAPKEEKAPPVIPPVVTPVPSVSPSEKSRMAAASAVPPPRPVYQEPEPSFFEKHPDLEKFIGENLVNKIGIGILVLGIGFFVKYAIDKEWINEIGRVGIGILCGGILLAIAHRLRNKFNAFSSVLVGGGIAVLYFTIAIAFHQYHLFSQTAAFVIMVIITGFSVALAISYDRVELAVLSIIGGFSTPFMLSTGQGNYVVLFTYITILNSGMLVLAYFKKWNILNILSYLFTVLLFGGWLFTKVIDREGAPYTGALLFASIFYVLFFLMNIINNVKEDKHFSAAEISILLSNTFLFYACGYVLLEHIDHGKFTGLFTAGLGVFNFCFTYFLSKKKIDPTLLYLLIGLVMTFISLAGPVQLEGNHITLFWAAEAVLLLWLGQKSGFSIIKRASMLITMLTVVSLLQDWSNYYRIVQSPFLNIILNKAFITSIVSLASFAGTIILIKREPEDKELIPGISPGTYKNMVFILFAILLYVSMLLELNYQLSAYMVPYASKQIVLGAYNLGFCLAFFAYSVRIKNTLLKDISVGMSITAILIYIAFYHQMIIEARNSSLLGIYGATGFWLHYVDLLLVVTLLVLSVRHLYKNKPWDLDGKRGAVWFGVIISVFLLSAELCNITVLASYKSNSSISDIIHQTSKIGYSILWSVSSFVMMYIGMRKKLKELRVASLTLFMITIIKLFAYDIIGISEGGKIAAFISLGVLLLVVSFMYQKLKNLILTDEKDESDEASAQVV
jgi:uncharacterized membrane protein